MTTEFDDDVDLEGVTAVARAGSAMTRFQQSQESLDDLFSEYHDLLAPGGTRRPSSASFTPPREVPDDPLEKLMNESDDSAHDQFKREPEMPRHFKPVVKMVSEMRTHPAFARVKESERWVDLVTHALEYCEQASAK